jgi:hypothetical protein
MPGFETILPFLKPIEHLILDDSISEVMVNGPDQVFVEKAGFIEQVRGVSLLSTLCGAAKAPLHVLRIQKPLAALCAAEWRRSVA